MLKVQSSIVVDTGLWMVNNLNYSGILRATYQIRSVDPISLLPLYRRVCMTELWNNLNNSFDEAALIETDVAYVRVVCGTPGVGTCVIIYLIEFHCFVANHFLQVNLQRSSLGVCIRPYKRRKTCVGSTQIVHQLLF